MFLASIYVFHYIYYWGVPPSRPSPNYLPSEEEANHLALFRWFPEVTEKKISANTCSLDILLPGFAY